MAVQQGAADRRGDEEGRPPPVAEEERECDEGCQRGREDRQEDVAHVGRSDFAHVLRPQEEDGVDPEQQGMETGQEAGSAGGHGVAGRNRRRWRAGRVGLRFGHGATPAPRRNEGAQGSGPVACSGTRGG